MKITIVDDEKEILSMLERFLSKKGHEITSYENPLTALSSIKENTDIVILDVMMPQMNGLDMLTELHKKFPTMKVIIMTAYSTLDKVLDAHRNGAVYYIMKPFESLEKLEAKILEISVN